MISISVSSGQSIPLTDRQQRVLGLHLDPGQGSPYWVRKSQELGLSVNDLKTLDDLALFQVFDQKEAAKLSYREIVPAKVLREASHLILGETGGTLGSALTSVWQPDEFHCAFISPFLQAMKNR